MTDRPPAQVSDFGPDEKYFKALGLFIEVFALVEVGMFHLLVYFSGLGFRKGQALLSGAKIDQCLQFISRIWEVEQPPANIRMILDDVFVQLKIINDMRNRIVHNASTVKDDERFVSDETRQLREEKVRRDDASPETLNQMTKDCSRINVVLRQVLAPETLTEAHQKILSRGWLYKPTPNHRKSDKI